jgi:drug/metabolite transporter (DMT)-like permease
MSATAHQPQAYRQGVLAIITASVLWSLAGIGIKIVHAEAPAIALVRALAAAVTFRILFGPQVFRLSAMTLLTAGFYVSITLGFIYATRLTSAANAIFLQYTAPVYILIVEPWLFQIPRRRRDVWTVIACLAGMVLFFWGSLGSPNLAGDLLALGTGVMMAGFMVAQRYNKPEYHAASIFWGNILLALICLPILITTGAWPDPAATGLLIGMGVIQLGIPYALFTYSIGRILAIDVVLLSMLEPVLNPLWVMIGFGERPSWHTIAGGAIILLSLAIRALIMQRESRS